jgi:hypothetical protein
MNFRQVPLPSPLPPTPMRSSVHRFCSLEDDIEVIILLVFPFNFLHLLLTCQFKTVTTIQCSIANDECVKVRAENEGKELTISSSFSIISRPGICDPWLQV